MTTTTHDSFVHAMLRLGYKDLDSLIQALEKGNRRCAKSIWGKLSKLIFGKNRNDKRTSLHLKWNNNKCKLRLMLKDRMQTKSDKSVSLDNLDNVVQLDSLDNVVQLDSLDNVVQLDSLDNVVQLDSLDNLVQLESLDNIVKLYSLDNVEQLDIVDKLVCLDSTNKLDYSICEDNSERLDVLECDSNNLEKFPGLVNSTGSENVNPLSVVKLSELSHVREKAVNSIRVNLAVSRPHNTCVACNNISSKISISILKQELFDDSLVKYLATGCDNLEVIHCYLNLKHLRSSRFR